MGTVKILIFALFHFLNYQNCDLKFLGSDGSCQTDYGKRGICVRIEQCPGIRELLKRGLFPEICHFDDLTPVVCCDQNAVLPSQLGSYGDIVNQNVGGYCQTDYGRQGTYLSIEQCPSTQELLKRGISPNICYFDGLTPIVCCELSGNLLSPQSHSRTYGEIATQNINGYYCETGYGKQGIYLRMDQCDSTQELRKRGILPDIYYFDGLPPMVCCARSGELPSPPSQLGKYEDIATQNIGRYCQSDNGGRGTCLSREQCLGNRELLKRGVFSKLCQYNDVTPIVCCDQGDDNSTQLRAAEAVESIAGSCPTHTGTQGICVSIEKCSTAQQSRSNICRYNGTIPIVCCEQSDQQQLQLRASNAQIARRHCEEYVRNTQTTTTTTTTTTTKMSRATQEATKVFVVVGMDASENQFPHMAALGLGHGKDDNLSWVCGGSLISEKFVITAAHCTESLHGKVQRVALGAHRISNLSSKSPQTFYVKETIVHPNYKFGENYNDIALIELDGEAIFQRGVSPACLHTERVVPTEDFTVAGWGATDFVLTSDILQFGNLKFVAPSICSQAYRPGRAKTFPRGLDDSLQICARGDGTRTDACQGDSGGPLQINRTSEVATIVGIISTGFKCGTPGVPAVYTRVSNYIPWIEGIVWPNES